MYRYRIYPSRKQNVRIINSLKICKAIYNELLDISKKTYKETGKTLRKFDYNKQLTGKYPEIYSQVKQNVSDRVHKAFSNFFRRVKDNSCKEKGFPRFKGRVNSITFPQSGFKIISDKRLRLSKVGNVPIILHRVPKGKIKTLTIKQNKAGQWFATFACELSTQSSTHIGTHIGIDVGLESYAVLSNGEFIDNPRHILKAETRLKLLQRRVSRKIKGSANRRKAKFLLAKQHIKVANQRTDFLHKLSHKITQSYSFIAVENLNVKSMLNNHWMAKSISDASWSNFIRCLEYKAVKSGSKLVKVNPRNTSKTCSKCGTIIEMPLSKREFLCPHCGFACHRDLNASINILKVGTDCPKLNACRHNVRPSFGKAVVDEAGTIMTEPSTSSVIGSPTL
jgi:putative transposase